MPASEARILANQANSKLSTGPRTVEGKERSRQNALKHGLTGEGVALLNEDAVEVHRIFVAFQDELKPSGELGQALVKRPALLSVRMDRCVSQESTALNVRMCQVEAEFVAPEGVNAAEADQLRAQAGAQAMFDSSKEACLARKYEASAERGFFRTLKEFRQVEKATNKANPAASTEAYRKSLGSFLPEKMMSIVDSLPLRSPQTHSTTPSKPAPKPVVASFGSAFDVPFAIGKAR